MAAATAARDAAQEKARKDFAVTEFGQINNSRFEATASNSAARRGYASVADEVKLMRDKAQNDFSTATGNPDVAAAARDAALAAADAKEKGAAYENSANASASRFGTTATDYALSRKPLQALLAEVTARFNPKMVNGTVTGFYGMDEDAQGYGDAYQARLDQYNSARALATQSYNDQRGLTGQGLAGAINSARLRASGGTTPGEGARAAGVDFPPLMRL